MKKEGRGIDDQFMIALLQKRTQSKDCLQNGWILEDFPKTKLQAQMMAQAGLNPTNVLFIRISNEEVYSRTLAQSQDDFECNRSIVANRLRFCEAN